MTDWKEIQDGTKVPLRGCEGAVDRVHVFDGRSILAMQGALAARRPLLVRGEPGTGKSQLALAAATALEWPLLTYVVHCRTTAEELLWSFDAVARLAEAQLAGALGERGEAEVRRLLEERRFVTPGPLWWALHWESAAQHAREHDCPIPDAPEGWTPAKGAVVLIDEIDKADSDVPNGLLEVLGLGKIRPQGYAKPLELCGAAQPLIIITTNEERALPDAFVRRCLVLQIELPQKDDELKALLVARGHAHFESASRKVLEEAAAQLIEDRKAVQARSLPPPGQAEYLDLVRAVIGLRKEQEEQLELLKQLRLFTFQKHPAGHRG